MIAIACFTVEEARRRLRMTAAHSVDIALGKFPHGPVSTACNLTRSEIVYKVIVGEGEGAITIWTKTIAFGGSWRHKPGGIAFREAAHEQDMVAWAMVTLLEQGAPPEWVH